MSVPKRDELLAERFESARPRLERIARRILGSAAESDDALQESWMRASRAGISGVENLDGWLTTVTARVCLDQLERRKSRREEFTPVDPRLDTAARGPGERPEDEALLADSIGVAMTVLLDALAPAERVAFVMHDIFDVPFDEIAAVVGRTPEAARQLASRARRRVRGTPMRDSQTTTLRADAAVMAMGGAAYWESDLESGIEGADAVAGTFLGKARAARPALIDGEPGAVWMHDGALQVAFRFTVIGDRITAIELVADRDALSRSVIERSV